MYVIHVHMYTYMYVTITHIMMFVLLNFSSLDDSAISFHFENVKMYVRTCAYVQYAMEYTYSMYVCNAYLYVVR